MSASGSTVVEQGFYQYGLAAVYVKVYLNDKQRGMCSTPFIWTPNAN